jgi:hypothetical protein
MSVTFASGIIPTSVLSRLVTSISRFSVITKYLRHQVATFQPCQTASTAHSTQTSRTNPALPGGADPVTKPAKSAPARISAAGAIMAIGCIRTERTIRSLGKRYRSTSRGGR